VASGLSVVDVAGESQTLSPVGYAGRVGDFLYYYRRPQSKGIVFIRGKEAWSPDLPALRNASFFPIHAWRDQVFVNVGSNGNYSLSFGILDLSAGRGGRFTELKSDTVNESSIDFFAPSGFVQFKGRLFVAFSYDLWFLGEIGDGEIKMIARSESPRYLSHAGLNGIKTPFIEKASLSLKDFRKDAVVDLGRIDSREIYQGLRVYVDRPGKRRLFDFERQASFPAPDGVDWADGFDGGYYYSEPGSGDIRFIPTTWHIMAASADGRSIEEIVRLEKFPPIEKVIAQDGKLYISAWWLGLVFDVKGRSLSEVYGSPGWRISDGAVSVVQLLPFEGRTFVYPDQASNYPGQD
jgi:hypothetical protein